jgi:S1-C subfamily serine protease
MSLLRFVGALVVLLGLTAAAVVVAPGAVGRGASRAFAQVRDRDATQTWRGPELTALAGRGSGIGVRIADRAEGGVTIEDVQGDSPADKAGLRQSDVIVEFDGEHVRSARQFARLVQETPPGRTVKATITRDGQRKEVQVTPDDRRGDVMALGDFRDYMRGFGRDLGRLNDRVAPFNFNLDIGPPAVSGRRLGVTVEELSGQLAEYFGAKGGVLVTSVTDGSPAARAGLRAGDVIASVNGDRIGTRDDLLRALRDATSEDVKIDIVRDKKESSVTAKIDAPRRTPRGRPA